MFSTQNLKISNIWGLWQDTLAGDSGWMLWQDTLAGDGGSCVATGLVAAAGCCRLLLCLLGGNRAGGGAPGTNFGRSQELCQDRQNPYR